METYKIIRGYANHDDREVLATGLTLEEAREYCRDPETSSSTCTLPENVARTAARGPWFDRYDEE